MDIKLVRELAEIVKELNLSTIEVEEGETKIKIENAKAEREANSAPQLAPINTATQFVAPNPAMEKDPGLDFNDVKTVDSPMVGVFYAAPNPDSEPYVALGSKVKKGDVLCIIEAMKLMNEIQSDYDCEIEAVLVSNEQKVEYGQPLFRVKRL